MSRRLTDEEIAARYSNQYRVETPEAGLTELGGSAIDRLQAKAYGLVEPLGLSRDYRLAQEAEAERTSQRYYDTNQGAVGSYKNISGIGDVGRYAAELGVQSLPEIVPVVGAGIVGGPAAAFGVAGLSGIGEVMQAQRAQAGRTDLTAIPLGLAYGGAEAATGIVGKLAGTGIRAERAAAVANRYLDNLGGFTGGAARTGAAAGRTGFSEAVGEVGQEYISNVGRLAVDPRVDLFSPEALNDYAESFVGGGLLGGLLGGAAGGWRRSQGFREAARERDLTSSMAEEEAPLQRPLESQFVTQDQTLGLQSFINQNVGITRPKRRDYVAQFKAAYDEPTGQFVNDPETGIERPLTVGEALQRSQAPLDMTQEKPADAAATAQVVASTVRDPRSYELRDTFGVIPTPSSLQLYSDIQASGLPVDSDLLVGVWAYAGEKPMTPKRLEKAQQLLDAAIIEARKEAPIGTGISTVQQPAGSVGVGSPVVQGGMGDAGRPAAVTGAVVGGAPAAGAPLQQAGVLPIAAGQPTTPVTTTAPAAAPAPETRFRRAPRPMTVLEAANAAKAAQAQQTETQGQTAPAAAGPVVDERQAILQQIFGQRNGDIIFDVVGMGMPEPEAAAKYGLSRQAIQKIAGATGAEQRAAQIQRAKVEKGITDEQIATAFQVAPQEELGSEVEREIFGAGRPADAITETEAIEGGLENIVKTAGAGTSEVEGFTKLDRDIDATLEALIAETDAEKIAALKARLQELEVKAKAVAKKAQAEVRRTAGKVTEPTVEGEADAVQVESPAGVSVQPEAGTGEKVGRQVRGAKKPAAEGKAQVPAKVLTEAEQAAEAWDKVAADFPEAPKFADLTKEQQENFIEFGSDNWGKDDVELELTKLARQPAAKVEYPTPPPGAPAYVQPAQRAVVDFMNGDVTKQQLLERFAKLGMTEGQIRSVTNRIDITKDEIDSVQDLKAVLGFTRQSRQATRLFTTDLYLGKENVSGQPQYGRELRNPVTLNDGTRLDGFTSPDQSVFSGYDRNGQRISVPQESVKPSDIKASRDSNRTANALKAALGTTRKSRRSVRTADQSGVEFESVEASLDDLSGYSEGIAAGIRSLRSSGMGNAVDAIDSWMVTFSPVSWDAIYTMIDGKRTIIYNGVILKDKVLATTATLHEVGHGIDEVQTGAGKFSNDKEFKLSRVNGELMSMRPGTVVDELLTHWEDASETSALGGMLNYPLDMTDPENRTLTMQELREELFAQVWAFSNMNGGMDYLRDNLPTTYAFMEKAHEQVKATNYAAAKGAQQGAQSGQVQAGQQNAQPAGTILRASRQAKQGLIDRNIAKLPKQSQQPVKNLTAALGDLGGKYLDYAVFTNDLVKRAQALGLTAAKTFSDRLAARNAKVSEEERKIEKIADGYALIEDANKGDGPDSVNQFLFESTRTGKWGYGKYRDAKMGAAFDKLGPKAQQFVKDVFAHGDAMLSNKKRIVLNATNSEYDAMIKAAQDDGDTQTEAKLKAEKAATLKRFQTLFRIREGVPYAPIKRTGAYVVIGESDAYKAAKAKNDTATVKKLESDPDHYHVSFVDTKWQARNLSDKLSEQGVFTSPQIVKRSESFDEAFSGEAMLPALTKMRAAVDRRAQDANGKKDPSAGKLLNIINQLYLEALAEGSARKSEMRRRGVAGEVDMLQSFTQQGRADANFLASVEYEPKIQDALQQMRNQSRTGDRERKSEIFDELTKRYADSLEPKNNPFINGLTNMASKFFLASSPGYYLQNLTQPFMMSLPAMAGRHDYTKAAAELAKAYTELGPLFKDVKLFDQQFDFSKVPADVRTAINDLVNQGKIDIGLATEINEYKVDADGKLSQFAQRLNKGMRMAVQKVEATNRLSTAIAAYRLEYARTKDAAKATQYAADILTDTHGDYTAFNAPRAFNTQWGKVALQFRKFQLIQIAFYAKLIRDAFTKPEERAAALRTLAYSLSHTAVFAGMMGLPGYAAISAILGFFGDEDEPYDLTAEMRKALGPEWADMIMRGAPTVVGMDLSGKIGSGNMLSIMPFSDADLSTNAGRAEAFGTLMGGAALGMTSRVIDGLGLIASGDYYKGVERTMPKGVSDALKAGRQAAEGMTRRNGDVILPDSEIGAIDTVLTALGVPAVKQAVTYERQNRMRDITENFTDRTTRIKNDYAKAVREKDTEGMAEARAAWTKLQQARQRNGLKPQPVSNLLKAPQEQKAREQRTVGGVAYREGQKKLAESVAAN